ncbi:hypothetical protein BDQ17DRAFT_1038611 [Cyathus striatus]|nr:hypothetical protein BDQ17DRAFT_1038611 [Cyathus striatus]
MSSTISAQDISNIKTALFHEYYRGFFQVAPLAILIYDVFLTLDLEIDYFWRSPWTIISSLYVLVRYPTFIDVGISAISNYRISS